MKPFRHKAKNIQRSTPGAENQTGQSAGSSDRCPPYEWGCVHGRFQPFHNGHLEYVLRAKGRCRQLIVGITNPDPTRVRAEASSSHRHDPEANPFTYLERAMMVRDALLAEGLHPREFLIVPFPIQDSELYSHYAPADAVHFIRVYSNWEQEKVRRLRNQGLAVEVLDPGKEKEVSGVKVRCLIRSNLPWEHLVPETTASIVRRTLATGEPDAE